jgi:hypothetical protein
MKNVWKLATVMVLAVMMVGCGRVVEVGPAQVAKIMEKSGYKEGIIPTSKFRLDMCYAYCDKLVVLDASDRSFKESMDLFMPADKLLMTFDIRATMSLASKDYEQVFNKVQPAPVDNSDRMYMIPLEKVYLTYARDIIRAEAREFLSTYSIAEIASSREAINAELSVRLSESIAKRTPFSVRYIGIADLKYPEIIIAAQENAAERREMINQEAAQLEISKVQLERKLQEQTMQRRIDVEKAQAEAEVNKIMGDSMTAEYKAYKSIQVMEVMAASQNKVFMPTEMLNTVAGQIQLGK